MQPHVLSEEAGCRALGSPSGVSRRGSHWARVETLEAHFSAAGCITKATCPYCVRGV